MGVVEKWTAKQFSAGRVGRLDATASLISYCRWCIGYRSFLKGNELRNGARKGGKCLGGCDFTGR